MDEYLNPYQEKYVKCKTTKSSQGRLYLEPSAFLLNNGCHIDTTLEKKRNMIKIRNTTANIISLPAGNTLASIRPAYQFENEFSDNKTIYINYLVTYDSMSAEDKTVHDRELHKWKKRRDNLVNTIPISSEVTKCVRNAPTKFKLALGNLLNKFEFIFARSKNDSGLAKYFLVDLTFKNKSDTSPVYRRPYRLDPTTVAALTTKITELTDNGILEPTSSPWNTPVLGIKKGDGSYRMVNNFSGHNSLNERLIRTVYPIIPMRTLFSRISACIQVLKQKWPGQRIVMSQIDIRNGFYTLAIKDSKRDMTAFILSDRQVQYARLSQGLALAPGDFQQFIHTSYAPCENSSYFLLNYLDDFMIISVEGNHLDALSSFFKQTLDKNIVLALQKCKFFVNEIKFLGFVVNEKGYSADKSKIDTLLQLKNPKTAKEGMRVMGIYQFFTRNLPRMSFYLHPLATEIAKKERFQLNDLISTGIERIKDCIRRGLATTHLSYSNENGNTIFLAVDSSLYACGFALGNCTIVDNEMRNITFSHFGSKIFDPVVCLMSSRSRELIGLASGLECFSDILPSTVSITAYVDHESLIRIQSSQTLGKTSVQTRIRNAYAAILNYADLKLCHLPGKSNLMTVVDGISRSFYPTKEINKDILNPKTVLSNNYTITRPTVSIDTIKKEQILDIKTKIIIDKLTSNATGTVIYKSKKYAYRNNTLCLITEDGKYLTVIPENIAYDLVDYLHVKTLHQGALRLQSAIFNADIYIKGRTRLINQICRNCLFCQMSTPTKYKSPPDVEFKIRPGFSPFTEISIDLMDISYGNSPSYLLTFLDKFSNFVDGEILTTKSADTVVPALMILLTKYNCEQSSSIASDNGGEFLSNLMKSTFERLGIHHNKITAWNSRANPVERAHRELRHILMALETNSLNFKWKTRIGINHYNNTPQKKLGYLTPNQIILGLKPKHYLTDYQEKSSLSQDTLTTNELPLVRNK